MILGSVPKLLVVSPNLAVDRILEVNEFRSATVQRSLRARSQPGGKGSNVARVYRQLGGEVVLAGFVGQRNGSWIVDPLQALGIEVDAIEAYAGESRTCTIICDTGSTHHPTVVNEETPEIAAGAAESLLARIDHWSPRVSGILVTGSLSRGLPADFYRAALERAGPHPLLAALDATGPPLREGLRGAPMILKANLEEVSSALGDLGVRPRDIASSLLARRDALPEQIIVTLGDAGAILIYQDRVWFVEPPRISYANPIGNGDAFAAGYLKACLDGRDPPYALRFAAAVAASDAATLEPGSIIPDEIPSLLAATSLLEWDGAGFMPLR